jgi:hypothetical protein
MTFHPTAPRQKTTSKPSSHSQNHLPLNSSMDSFFTLFTLYSEPETAPETSTPIEALDGGPQYCVVA